MINLSSLHTFAFDYQAKQLQCFDCVESLIKGVKKHDLFSEPHFVLGEGSNTLFCQDFAGSIVKFTGEKLYLGQDQHYYYLQVDAGFNWHSLVRQFVDLGIYGLENLALIPGLVGAAPIQNIGAYGVELSDVLDFVEFVDKETLKVERLKAAQLQLGYRDSIFKHQLANKVVITKVGLKLNKKWRANNSYKGLEHLNDAKLIYQQVIKLRQSKLPDPKSLPNAGSFFKNPLVSNSQFAELKERYTNPPHYLQGDKVKIPAAWLIEQCGLKGYRIGGVGVYEHHGLILVNHANGSGDELIKLVQHIKQTVKHRFFVDLEIEVRLVGRDGLLEIT